MLGSIRKFSNSIYAKIFLVIVAIPFIFWGMGPVFQAGNKNIIVEIGKEKVNTQEFINFVKSRLTSNDVLDDNLIDKLLSNFIGERLIFFETQELGMKISDDALSKIIKNENIFKKENKFSRTEYEKFLVKNSLSAIAFEKNLLKQSEKDQFFNFLAGGISPPNFLVDIVYNKINQKRNIQLINLNEIFKKKFNFSNDQIKSYFEENKNNYNVSYKYIKFIELTPKNLINEDEFNNIFFQSIDEIDDLTADGKDLNYIAQKFNLDSVSITNFDYRGLDKDGKRIKALQSDLILNLFKTNEDETTRLVEHDDKYFIIEVLKTENVQKKISDVSVKNDVLKNLKNKITRKSISKIISKINNNDFKKIDFDKLSKDENVKIQNIKLENANDNKIIKKELLDQIYRYPEKRVVVVADLGFVNNYLIYIDDVENASIDNNSEEYKKYFNLAKAKMTNNLYNTYDYYLSKKYKININYNALDSIKNSMR